MTIEEQLRKMPIDEWAIIHNRAWNLYFDYHYKDMVPMPPTVDWHEWRVEVIRMALAGMCDVM